MKIYREVKRMAAYGMERDRSKKRNANAKPFFIEPEETVLNPSSGGHSETCRSRERACRRQ